MPRPPPSIESVLLSPPCTPHTLSPASSHAPLPSQPPSYPPTQPSSLPPSYPPTQPSTQPPTPTATAPPLSPLFTAALSQTPSATVPATPSTVSPTPSTLPHPHPHPHPHPVPYTTNPAASCTSILLSPSRTSTLTNAHMDGDRDRPPGGTRRSGAKTPRKVQWMVDERGADPQEKGDERVASPRALDEHGLDPEAFSALTARLTQHNAHSAPPPALTPLALSTPASQSTSGSTSPELTPTHAVPGETFIDPAETAGLPGSGTHRHSIRQARRVVGAHRRGGWLGLGSGSLGSFGSWGTHGHGHGHGHGHEREHEHGRGNGNGNGNGNGHTHSRTESMSAEEGSPTADMPLQRAGRKSKAQARKRRRWGLPGLHFGSGAEDAEDRADVERRAESRHHSVAAGLRPGTGVLGALLSLYDPEAQGASSATSARSSLDGDTGSLAPLNPAPSRQSGFFARGSGSGSGGEWDESATNTLTNAHGHGQGGVPLAHTQSLPAPPSPPSPPAPHRARTGLGLGLPGSANGSVISLKAPSIAWPRGFESRPPPTRNAAGVFGPLIASTGNITGVAAPTPATLAPSLKRPGYHLSRYSLESNLPQREEGKRERPSLARPRSMHFESASPPAPGHARASSLGPGVEPPSVPAETDESPASAKSTGALKGGRWGGGFLKDLPVHKGGWRSRAGTPSTSGTPATSDEEWLAEKERAWTEERRKEKKRQKRKKAEIYITRHVAEIVQRQEFILKLTRAMMMFGGPTHRLQAQIQSTAKVLEISLSCMYLPDMMLISFDDSATSTSNIKLIRQGSALDIGKLQDAHELYWKVIHDDISVKDASVDLDKLMRKPQLYKFWQLIIFGGLCSASICSVSFNGSFVDSLISFPLGCLLIVIQVFAARNELYSNIFEITVATIFSFIAAALSATKHFCYAAVASSSVVLILPGFIVLCGSLELSSRNIVSGAVRVCFSLIYSLFLGFGLAIGATAYSKLTHHTLRADDLTCAYTHNPHGPWYQRTPSLWWAFLTVPMYSLFLSLRNHAPYWRKELPMLVIISSIGWVTNHFTGIKFPNQSDISAAVGALAVGFISNVYGRFFNGNAFVVMITGILFQLPSGLANGGLFSFVSDETSGSSSSESYLSGFQTALQLISVSIGLTVGLGISLVVVHPIQSRRRAGGVFSL
ncbi:hypothetical protein AcW1_003155 [Taiwanofungus camphoratus]|nr:hypothetical protein AcW1_003155 [Antrodia cinnamomea]